GNTPLRALSAHPSAHTPTLAIILLSSLVVLRSHVCSGRVATANSQNSTATYWSRNAPRSTGIVAAAPDVEQSPFGSQHSGQLVRHAPIASANRWSGPRNRVMHSSVFPAYGGTQSLAGTLPRQKFFVHLTTHARRFLTKSCASSATRRMQPN